MIKGMSGFGQARVENKQFKAIIQVRSLNHRYLDCAVHLPEALRSLESYIKDIIKKQIKRGKVSVSIEIINKAAHKPHVNPQAVEAYMHLAKKLNKEFGVSSTITFSQLVSLPSVLGQAEQELLDNTAIRHLLAVPLIKALEGTIRMRANEGQAIYNDLKKRVKIIKRKIDYIESRLPRVFKQMEKKMSHEELGSFMRNCDVSEEIVRLKFHLNSLYRAASVSSSDPQGKELDFICQELQREANTLGAKVPEKYVSSAVVKIKGQLEKLREQLQNVE